MNDIAFRLSQALAIFTGMVLPALLLAVSIGLLIAILQAATQIQDQTLPQTAKILAVMGLFAVSATALTGPLVAFATETFTQFPSVVR